MSQSRQNRAKLYVAAIVAAVAILTAVVVGITPSSATAAPAMNAPGSSPPQKTNSYPSQTLEKDQGNTFDDDGGD